MMLTLHGYWRSSAAYRVRIGLALKGLAYTPVAHDLRRGEQAAAAYRALNPQGLVPALEAGGAVITQSLAILEWLDETHPAPPLLPTATMARAQVRAMVGVIACDIHPLNNLRVLRSMRHNLGADQAKVNGWIARWIGEGFTALEAMIAQQGGNFAFGDAPTLADCCLVPQVYSARRYGVDLAPWPRLVAVDAHCARLPAFHSATPEAQPDADGG